MKSRFSYFIPSMLIAAAACPSIKANCDDMSRETDSCFVSSQAYMPPNVLVGRGGLSATHYLTERCLANAEDPYAISYGNLQGSFDYTTSSEKLAEALNVKASGKIGLGIFSDSPAAKYVRATQNDPHTLYFHYIQSFSATASYRGPDKFGNEALNGLGQSALKLGEKYFLANCGDSYVEEAQAGAVFVISRGFKFESTQDKANFKKNFPGFLGVFASLKDSSSAMSALLSMELLVTVRAFQLGGDPSELSMIPGRVCSINDLEICDKTIGDLITYAQQQFPKQLKFDNKGQPLRPTSLFYFSPQFFKYSKIGIAHGSSFEITPALKSYQKKIMEGYNRDRENLVFLEHLLEAPIMKEYLYPETKQALTVAQKNLEKRLNLYGNNIQEDCYGDSADTQCAKTYQNIKNTEQKYPVDEEMIRHFREDVFVSSKGWGEEFKGEEHYFDNGRIEFCTQKPWYLIPVDFGKAVQTYKYINPYQETICLEYFKSKCQKETTVLCSDAFPKVFLEMIPGSPQETLFKFEVVGKKSDEVYKALFRYEGNKYEPIKFEYTGYIEPDAVDVDRVFPGQHGVDYSERGILQPLKKAEENPFY